ncbi:GNAT family N-acetyltransferase [Bacillus sp. CGMCC 1.16607]|uniref:GNAT family N-acetyltransferase n=1 Tax=Bacillus sp. CGMCC 1.16607 TaxID=3351842 RepID=UPI00363E643D
MLNILLKPITKENWEDAIQLKVNKDQESFMASNLYSIAEVQFLDEFRAMGVYLDELMVGFTLFGIDPDDGNYWVYRLMVDHEHQGKGYGVLAVQEIIDYIIKQNHANIPYIMIGYHPENYGARQTYRKAGFVETEIAPWGEQLAKYNLL